jgi:hypothetical protein
MYPEESACNHRNCKKNNGFPRRASKFFLSNPCRQMRKQVKITMIAVNEN